jgi:hypothetical protein
LTISCPFKKISNLSRNGKRPTSVVAERNGIYLREIILYLNKKQLEVISQAEEAALYPSKIWRRKRAKKD